MGERPQLEDRRQTTGGRRVTVGGIAIFLVAFVAFVGTFAVSYRINASRNESAREYEQSRREHRRKVMEEVRAGTAHVQVFRDDAELLEMLADDEACTENVRSIGFFMTDCSSASYHRLREFRNLRELSFYDCDHVDELVIVASRLPRIERLYFEVTPLSDSSLEAIANFPQLKRIEFEQVMPDAIVERLRSRLPNVTIEAHLESEERGGRNRGR